MGFPTGNSTTNYEQYQRLGNWSWSEDYVHLLCRNNYQEIEETFSPCMEIVPGTRETRTTSSQSPQELQMWGGTKDFLQSGGRLARQRERVPVSLKSTVTITSTKNRHHTLNCIYRTQKSLRNVPDDDKKKKKKKWFLFPLYLSPRVCPGTYLVTPAVRTVK